MTFSPPNLFNSLCLYYFHLRAQKPNLEKFSIYSNKFFHNFHLSESSFTCPRLQASGLARGLQEKFCRVEQDCFGPEVFSECYIIIFLNKLKIVENTKISK
jgi:hypothetical protein